jgi:hypothetical protein
MQPSEPTRVQRLYHQLRYEVPQLSSLPSVIVHLIAEYGPPSLLVVYSNNRCFALYPADVVTGVMSRVKAETERMNDSPTSEKDGMKKEGSRNRIQHNTTDKQHARNRSPAKTAAPSIEATYSLDPWKWGWVHLPIIPHRTIPVGSSIQVPSSSSLLTTAAAPPVAASTSASSNGVWMSYREWCHDDWVYVSDAQPSVIHVPHNEAVTAAYRYNIPPLQYGRHLEAPTIYRYDTGFFYIFNDEHLVNNIFDVLLPPLTDTISPFVGEIVSQSSTMFGTMQCQLGGDDRKQQPVWFTKFPRHEHTRGAAAVVNYIHFILVIGGYHIRNWSGYEKKYHMQYNTIDAFNVRTNRWMKSGSFPSLIVARHGCKAIMANDTVIVLGGVTDSKINTSVEVIFLSNEREWCWLVETTDVILPLCIVNVSCH